MNNYNNIIKIILMNYKNNRKFNVNLMSNKSFDYKLKNWKKK